HATMLRARVATALATVRAEEAAEWLCRRCNVVHAPQLGGITLHACPDCRAPMYPSSPLRRDHDALQARVTALEDLVRRMRDAQRRYYKTRDKAVLIESKELEREVGCALAPGA